MNPAQDSLQQLVQRLETYARDMAATKHMEVKINGLDQLHEYDLPMQMRRNIYLFCKEAINNAVKYSNANLLELSVLEHSGVLEFLVSDNGKGFDEMTMDHGNGLNNMQQRAVEIGAMFNIRTKLTEGTIISMQIKIT